MMETQFKPTLDECKAIAELYGTGTVSIPVLIAKHRTSGKHIHAAILKGGGKILPPYRDRFAIPEDRKQTMCDLYRAGASKEDNRLSNLQLRVSAHGSGVLLQCRDCGSHNIQSLELPPGKAVKN